MPTHPVTYSPTCLLTCVAWRTLPEHPMPTCVPVTMPDYPPSYRRTYPLAFKCVRRHPHVSTHVAHAADVVVLVMCYVVECLLRRCVVVVAGRG